MIARLEVFKSQPFKNLASGFNIHSMSLISVVNCGTSQNNRLFSTWRLFGPSYYQLPSSICSLCSSNYLSLHTVRLICVFFRWSSKWRYIRVSKPGSTQHEELAAPKSIVNHLTTSASTIVSDPRRHNTKVLVFQEAKDLQLLYMFSEDLSSDDKLRLVVSDTALAVQTDGTLFHYLPTITYYIFSTCYQLFIE